MVLILFFSNKWQSIRQKMWIPSPANHSVLNPHYNCIVRVLVLSNISFIKIIFTIMTTAIFPSYSCNIFLPVNHSKSTASKAFVAFLHNMLSQPPHSFVIILTITAFTTYRVLFAPLKSLQVSVESILSTKLFAKWRTAKPCCRCIWMLQLFMMR